MKSNENFVIDLLSFGGYDRGQRASAAAATRTAQRRSAATAAPSQIRPVKGQSSEIQKTAAARHPASAAKRRTTEGHPATPKRRHTTPAAKGHPPTPKTRVVMLLNDLYCIDHIEAGAATLRLNAAHPIFDGHFPGRPILPGACQLQMIREMLSGITGKDYRLQKADTIKFITPIDPRQNPIIRLDLQYDEVQNAVLRVTASMQAGEAICLKFNGIFQAE
jgi:3-hydroxyacyl-[acyl-carrier-protein] dehydratase